MKIMILWMGAAFLLLACQVAGYRPESSTQVTAPGKVGTSKVDASGGHGGDYIKLERAYLGADKPEQGAPLMVSFEGDITRRPTMDGGALTPTVVVRRFIGVGGNDASGR